MTFRPPLQLRLPGASQPPISGATPGFPNLTLSLAQPVQPPPSGLTLTLGQPVVPAQPAQPTATLPQLTLGQPSVAAQPSVLPTITLGPQTPTGTAPAATQPPPLQRLTLGPTATVQPTATPSVQPTVQATTQAAPIPRVRAPRPLLNRNDQLLLDEIKKFRMKINAFGFLEADLVQRLKGKDPGTKVPQMLSPRMLPYKNYTKYDFHDLSFCVGPNYMAKPGNKYLKFTYFRKYIRIGEKEEPVEIPGYLTWNGTFHPLRVANNLLEMIGRKEADFFPVATMDNQYDIQFKFNTFTNSRVYLPYSKYRRTENIPSFILYINNNNNSKVDTIFYMDSLLNGYADRVGAIVFDLKWTSGLSTLPIYKNFSLYNFDLGEVETYTMFRRQVSEGYLLYVRPQHHFEINRKKYIPVSYDIGKDFQFVANNQKEIDFFNELDQRWKTILSVVPNWNSQQLTSIIEKYYGVVIEGIFSIPSRQVIKMKELILQILQTLMLSPYTSVSEVINIGSLFYLKYVHSSIYGEGIYDSLFTREMDSKYAKTLTMVQAGRINPIVDARAEGYFDIRSVLTPTGYLSTIDKNISKLLKAATPTTIDIVAKQIGFMFPPKLPKAEKLKYFRENISYWSNVFTRKIPLSDLPSVFIDADNPEDMLKYTDKEIVEGYEIPEWTSRVDLIARAIQRVLIVNDKKWWLGGRTCINDVCQNIIDRDFRNKADYDDFIISYGNFSKHVCYNIGELISFFRETDTDDQLAGWQWEIPDKDCLTEKFSKNRFRASLIRIGLTEGRGTAIRPRGTFTNNQIEELFVYIGTYMRLYPNTIFKKSAYKTSLTELIAKVQEYTSKIPRDGISKYRNKYLALTTEQKQQFLTFAIWMFVQGMWLRKWKGPGKTFPESAGRDREDTAGEGIWCEITVRDFNAMREFIKMMGETRIGTGADVRVSPGPGGIRDGFGEPVRHLMDEIPRYGYSFTTGGVQVSNKTIMYYIERMMKGQFCLRGGSDALLQTSYAILSRVIQFDPTQLNTLIVNYLKTYSKDEITANGLTVATLVQPPVDPRRISTTWDFGALGMNTYSERQQSYQELITSKINGRFRRLSEDIKEIKNKLTGESSTT